MLRDIIVNGNNHADATYKTSGAYKTGMGVTKTLSAGTVAIPAAETASDVFVLQKARTVSGDMAARTQFSDYEPEFNEFAEGELCVLYTYAPGEQFATDQYVAADMVTANIGKYVAVNTSGKWCVATATTVTSKYVFKGTMSDAGHTLAVIEVVDTPAANAASAG